MKTNANYRYYWLSPQGSDEKLRSVSANVIKPALQSASQRFDITIKRIRSVFELPAYSHGQSTYLLVGPIYADDSIANKLLYEELKALKAADKNLLINAFPVIRLHSGETIESAYKKGAFVRKVDKTLGINHIFPDSQSGDLLYPDKLDVESNIVCETFHHKVKTRHTNDEKTLRRLHKLRTKHKSALRELFNLVTRYKLYDRGPTDGAWFINESDSLLLASAARTDKTTLGSRDMVLIADIDHATNSVLQCGDRRHSSDVELATLAKKLNKRFLIHLHTPGKAVSRGWKLPELSTQQEYPYGESKYVDDIYKEAVDIFSNTKQDSLFNLKNHGLVFSVDDVAEIEDLLIRYPRLYAREA